MNIHIPIPFSLDLLTPMHTSIPCVQFRPFLSSNLSSLNGHFYLNGQETSRTRHGEIELIIPDSLFIFSFTQSVSQSVTKSCQFYFFVSLHPVQVQPLIICLNCFFCSQACSLVFNSLTTKLLECHL